MSIFDAASLPSGPTSKQVNTSSIQSWAQPYISDYLARSQALANQAPTAFQNQVASSAQGMGTPEQFAMGTNLANQGGQGSLSTAPVALNYGQMGAGIGSQGIGIGALGQQYGMNAGANYAAQATNPYAVGAYMNPYIQQSLAPQLQLLNQQQQLEQQKAQGQATGQGAFGGNRAALQQGLIGQNYGLAKQQAIGQGYNQAFQNAQQAQQFGANLGLQGAQFGTQAGLSGLGTALQGVNTGLQGVQGAQQGYQGATQAGSALSNIGAQQGQYQLGLLALQNQIANQQYQQPFQQQQFMQSMLSGLPISTGTTTGYQAPPNPLSQMAGVGSTLLGAYGLYNKAFGGNSNPTQTVTPGTYSMQPGSSQSGSEVVPLSNPSMPADTNGAGWGTGAGTDFGSYSQGVANNGFDLPVISQAKGGKVGSDLTDIQLHRLLG